MKIFLVAHSFVPFTYAGTEVYCYNLAKEFSKKHEVHIFCRVNDAKQKEFELRRSDYKGLVVYTVNNTFKKCRNFEETYSNQAIDRIFAQLLETVRPDIVHIQHLLFLSLGIIEESKKRRIPVVFTNNDYWLFCHKGQLIREGGILCEKPQSVYCAACLEAQLAMNPFAATAYRFLRKSGLFSLLRICKAVYLNALKILPFTRQCAQKAFQKREQQVRECITQIDCFVAPSKFMMQKLIENGVPIEKIVFSQYGIERQRFQVDKTSDYQDIRFCFIGTLLPTKGVHQLVAEFRGLKHQNAKLAIFGRKTVYAGYEGFYEELKKAVSKDERIKLMGEIENDKISRVYGQSDVVIVPSVWYENAPLVILEALAAHLPVVAARIGGIPELIQEGVNGLLFDPNQRGDLGKKLELFFEDQNLLLRLKQGAQGLRGIEENAQDMESIFTKLLNKNG